LTEEKIIFWINRFKGGTYVGVRSSGSDARFCGALVEASGLLGKKKMTAPDKSGHFLIALSG